MKKFVTVFVVGIAAASAASAQLLGLGVGAGVSADLGVSGLVRGATNIVNQTSVDVDASHRSRASDGGAAARAQVEAGADAGLRGEMSPPAAYRAPAPREGRAHQHAHGSAGAEAAARVRAETEVRVPRVELGVQSETRVRGDAVVR